jgi:hypothetical protein
MIFLWEYIMQHDLQDPGNGSKILGSETRRFTRCSRGDMQRVLHLKASTMPLSWTGWDGIRHSSC